MKILKNYKILILTTLISVSFFGFNSQAQNQPPTVNNVHFSQRTDGTFLVDIYYDLNDANGNAMTVSMQVSNDYGVTWTYSCPSTSGNKGAGQASGTNKHIVWDFAADHPNTFNTDFKIKIIADDGVASGLGTPCPGLASFTYGGQLYHTVQIGMQCIMKENLNIGTYVPSINTGSSHSDVSNNGIIEKYCYNNDPANCAIYGGLYDWNEMMQYSTTPGIQGICPTGWHIPTDAEWTTLVSFLGGSSVVGGKMKETGFVHWYSPNTGATNLSGFTAFGAGSRHYYGGFYNLQGAATFWSSSQYDATYAWHRNLSYNSTGIYRDNFIKAFGFSLRCFKD